MPCHRCAGLLLREWIYQTREHNPSCSCWWWKCANCGARVDATILRNQAEQAADVAWQQLAHAQQLKEWADWLATPAGPRAERCPPANRWDTAPDTAIAGTGQSPRTAERDDSAHVPAAPTPAA